MEACYKRAPSICLLCCTRRRCAHAQGHQGLLAHSSPISSPHLSRNPSHLRLFASSPSLLVSLVVSWCNWKGRPKMWAPHDGLLAKERTIYYGIQSQYWSNVLVYLLMASTRATHFIICICLFDWIWLSSWLFVIAWQRQLFWSSSVCFETFGKEIISCLKLQWGWTGWSINTKKKGATHPINID